MLYKKFGGKIMGSLGNLHNGTALHCEAVILCIVL
jgi:hypothetical protein